MYDTTYIRLARAVHVALTNAYEGGYPEVLNAEPYKEAESLISFDAAVEELVTVRRVSTKEVAEAVRLWQARRRLKERSFWVAKGFGMKGNCFYTGEKKIGRFRRSEDRALPYADKEAAQRACSNLNRTAANHGMWFEPVQIVKEK